jgi:hypothetical protein
VDAYAELYDQVVVASVNELVVEGVDDNWLVYTQKKKWWIGKIGKNTIFNCTKGESSKPNKNSKHPVFTQMFQPFSIHLFILLLIFALLYLFYPWLLTMHAEPMPYAEPTASKNEFIRVFRIILIVVSC